MGVFSPHQPRAYVPPLDRDGGELPSVVSSLLGAGPPTSNDWTKAIAAVPPPLPDRDLNVFRVTDGDSTLVPQGVPSQAPTQTPRRGFAPIVEPVPGSPEFETARRESDQIPQGRGVAPPTEPPSNSPELEKAFTDWDGRIVRLPDGAPVANPYSPTGYLMSPFSDLSDVAAAGRRVRSSWTNALGLNEGAAAGYVYNALRSDLAHGGVFDYQRRHFEFGKDGVTQLRQFRDVSNFNVGLYGQQAGLGLQGTLEIAGRYASWNSSNANPSDPHGLDPRTRYLIELGYQIGETGIYNRPNDR